MPHPIEPLPYESVKGCFLMEAAVEGTFGVPRWLDARASPPPRVAFEPEASTRR